MGETSIYYVPEREEQWIGREREVVETFWRHGVFLVTEDRFIYERIKQWKAEGKALPKWRHNFSFAEMGLGGLGEWEPVPNVVEDLRCPHCSGDLGELLRQRWEEESDVPLPDRSVTCHACGATTKPTDARSQEPFTFSRFYLWIADISDDDWDPRFKATVEEVLGPCREYRAWEA